MEKRSNQQTEQDEAQLPSEVANAQEVLPDSGADRTQASSYLQEVPIEEAPPPAYSESYGLVDLSQLGLNTRANVASDGRLDITINQKSHRFSNLLGPALRSQLNPQKVDETSAPPGYLSQPLGVLSRTDHPPPMNIVIQVVGSRGDVQPFISLGQVLKRQYGHRVRLATHPVFRDLIEESGLEFFSIGGDPAELMAFMVKNPGLMPGKDAFRSGDIGKRRRGMYEIIRGCWRSCFETGDGTGVEVSDSQMDYRQEHDNATSHQFTEQTAKPFVADAIIANPPSFAHVHCAEKLGIPLHLMFTMPWSPTQAFPHPLANIRSSNADVSMTNFITYALVEMMTWQGLGDVINRFREKSLGLEPVSLMWAPGMASRLRIPFTYCWSPALIPKPNDWGPHISVSGFFFLPLAESYTPPEDLLAFLRAGPSPIYIGFGSIVVDDPESLTELIFEAIKLTGQRALVSKGWGGLGANSLQLPEGVFMLGNVPHDWLFKHVSCVVHHGGAGTTAAGIALGKPTVVVPFFGDQPFWGAMIAKAGAGPAPIPHNQLNAAKLAVAISAALKPTALQRAQELGRLISSEKGSAKGTQSFHVALDLESLRCSLAPSRVAVWQVKRTGMRLSAFAAAVLGDEGLLDLSDLKLFRSKEYEAEDGPWEPISGATSALLGTIGSLMMGVADFPLEIFKAVTGKGTEESTRSAVDKRSPPIDSATTGRTNLQLSSSHPSPLNLLNSENEPVDSHSNSGGESSPAALNSISSPSRPSQQARLSQVSLISSREDTARLDAQKELSEQSLEPNATYPKNPSRQADRPSTENIGRKTSFDTAIGAGKSVGRIVGAGLKSPMDFTLGLAKGFHNAPKLYGDESVRQSDKITGFQSGLKAAGKEFGYGFYDGISGLVTQPLEGAKREGMAGLLKGFGKGIGGIVLKPGAAIFGLPGYTFKGIYKELQKHLGSSVQNYIIAARTAQGYDDWRNSSQLERLDIVSRWHAAQTVLRKQKKPGRKDRRKESQGSSDTRLANTDERIPSTVQNIKSKRQERTENLLGSLGNNDSCASRGNLEYEQATRESVAATSTGNAEEDAMIEKAVRASVAELKRDSDNGDGRDIFRRAIQASITEAGRVQPEQCLDEALGLGSRSDHDKMLEVALRMSMLEQGGTNELQRYHVENEWDDPDVDTDDDENIKRAIQISKLDAKSSIPGTYDLERGMIGSRKNLETHKEPDIPGESEEEIVLEYVKKQSLLEEQHRKSLAARSKDKEGE